MATKYIPIQEYKRVNDQLVHARTNLNEARDLLVRARLSGSVKLTAEIEDFLERTA